MMQVIILKHNAEGSAPKKQFCCSKKRKVGKIHGKETIKCKSNVTICAMLSRKLLTCCEDAVSLILLLQ